MRTKKQGSINKALAGAVISALWAAAPAVAAPVKLGVDPSHERFYCEADDGLGGLVIDGSFQVANLTGAGTFHISDAGQSLRDDEVGIIVGAWMMSRVISYSGKTRYRFNADQFFSVEVGVPFRASLSHPEKQGRRLQCRRVVSESAEVAFCHVGVRSIALTRDTPVEVTPGVTVVFGTGTGHFPIHKLEVTHQVGESAFVVGDSKLEVENALTHLQVTALLTGERLSCNVYIPSKEAK